ncbi:MAG TPA: hypothetical protein VML55_09790 [Planctomycetaceae bacterium]|nr:hypothetical protein [Planctomycetaceae bacterium]
MPIALAILLAAAPSPAQGPQFQTAAPPAPLAGAHASPRQFAQQPFARQPFGEQPLQPLPDAGPRSNPAASPAELKRITEILPYRDYEPDPLVRRDDPCLNLCPHPDDPRCREYPAGREPLCPLEFRLSEAPWQPREIGPSVFTWEASNLYHYPLYFEDPALERYGHTYGCLVQPFASVGRFSTQLVGLPYQMTIDPACRKIYTLGWYRPGECAPKLHYQIPWHQRAALNQALVVTGMFYLIP